MATRATNAPVEPKVKAASAGGAAIGVVIAILLVVSDRPEVFAGLPNWLSGLLSVVLSWAAPFLAGYKARHANRPPDAESA